MAVIPPSRKAAMGEIPGSQAARPSTNEALVSLVRTMGNSFIQLGEQMQKAPDIDTFQMARASSVLRQSQAALQRLGGRAQPEQGPPAMMSNAGKPQAPDRPVEPMTRRSVAGQLPGGLPTRQTPSY